MNPKPFDLEAARLGVDTGYKAALAGVKRIELDAAVELMLEEREK